MFDAPFEAGSAGAVCVISAIPVPSRAAENVGWGRACPCSCRKT